MLEEIDKPVKRLQGRGIRKLFFDPCNDLILNFTQQLVHALVMQVKCAAVDVRTRADIRDRDIGQRFFTDQIDQCFAQGTAGILYPAVQLWFRHGSSSLVMLFYQHTDLKSTQCC